jgi:hypothetical protein
MAGGQIVEPESRSDPKPTPSRQRRIASNATLGVKASIIPKNTACIVVIGVPTRSTKLINSQRR